ncbi:aspartate aminotransferase family protein [Nonomuraea sp. NPDC046802]|uniref:aspartate aminotransferase family protein n=1 Tax=Nonomuraea sp. NPDC046802 TaxID=3154919 RepID=UPI0033E113EA
MMELELQMPEQETGSVFVRARQRFSPGLVLGQKLAGSGAWEVSATGAWVVLSDGRQLLDFGSYAVALFGHRHPRVVSELTDQLGRIPTSTRTLLNPRSVELADRLVGALQPSRLSRAWFGLNGCDAVEVALKLARVQTGRMRVLAVEGGFHGKSLGALGATWNPRYREPLADALAPVTHIPPTPDAVAREVARGDVAAFLFEPVQGEGGIIPVAPELLRQWARDARANDVFVIADEIQTGFGRCGFLSLSQHYGIDVDAILFGKSMGGGVMPLSALVCTNELYQPLLQDPFLHSSVFSGHPLSCAAGSAALDLLSEHLDAIRALSNSFENMLASLVKKHDAVLTGFRGVGLLWGVECVSPAAAGNLLVELATAGLIVSPCLGRPDVIRLLPPAILNREDLEAAFGMLDRSVAVTGKWLQDLRR